MLHSIGRVRATLRPDRRTVPVVVLAVASVASGTLVIALLESATEIPDASAIYLIAVVVVGWVGGTVAAVGTAFVAFLIYDLLFTDPRLSLTVADPVELLNLVLVLIVALAIGRLAALGRDRAAAADRRAREATGLFAVSRLLATADHTEAVAGAIVERLVEETGLERVWIGLEGGPRERILADSGTGAFPTAAIVTTLVRSPGDEPARWIRAHDALARNAGGSRLPLAGDLLRVRIETGGTGFGSIWAIKAADTGLPGPEATRLLSLAADQLALGLRRDRLRKEATTAEVARRSDALKSALVDSVSHDLRTPLASIRATAGNLADPAVTWTDEAVRDAAGTIDDEAQRLDRFVESILDLSRIEAGALRPDLEVFDAGELIRRTVSRLQPRLADHTTTVEVAEDTPLLLVDAVLFDAILTNLLENVVDHTPADATIAIRVGRGDPGCVRVTAEDDGPGVAAEDLTAVFGRFQRARDGGRGARRGMGVGLSIVRGMAEALGGTATARRSELGGLAVDIDLPAAPEAPDDAEVDAR